jgi:hypothetical protein
MQRHGCGFPDAQLGPPAAKDIRRALQTLGRAGALADLLEALEAWSDDQIQQAT